MTIPEEAIVAAAKAMDAYWGGRYAPDEVEELRGEVTAMLKAAAPHLFAQALNDAGDRFETRSETLLKTMQNMAGHPDTSADDVVRYGAYSAESNTTATWLHARAADLRKP